MIVRHKRKDVRAFVLFKINLFFCYENFSGVITNKLMAAFNTGGLLEEWSLLLKFILIMSYTISAGRQRKFFAIEYRFIFSVQYQVPVKVGCPHFIVRKSHFVFIHLKGSGTTGRYSVGIT